MTLRTISLAASCLLLVACSEPEKPSVTDAEPPAEVEVQSPVAEETDTPAEEVVPETLEPEAEPQVSLAADIWQSPTELTVAGVVVNLSSELWLNSMPVIGDDGTKPAYKLHASVKLQSTDMQALPTGIEITQVLLDHEDKKWLVTDDLEVRAEGELSLEVALRGGPEWKPGSKVNIAVNIMHGGQEHILVQHDVVLAEVF